MAAFEDGDLIGFEEGFPWLPSYVLHEALLSDHTVAETPIKQHHHHHHHHHHRYYRLRHQEPQTDNPSRHSKSSSRQYYRPKHQNNWAANGTGMQAFFLVSSQKSSGTGVFLPATGSQATKKPACSPVLLPSRVVQALNLNVRSLGLQVSPRQDQENKSNKREKVDVSRRKCGAATPDSPEIFLPKEWTY